MIYALGAAPLSDAQRLGAPIAHIYVSRAHEVAIDPTAGLARDWSERQPHGWITYRRLSLDWYAWLCGSATLAWQGLRSGATSQQRWDTIRTCMSGLRHCIEREYGPDAAARAKRHGRAMLPDDYAPPELPPRIAAAEGPPR